MNPAEQKLFDHISYVFRDNAIHPDVIWDIVKYTATIMPSGVCRDCVHRKETFGESECVGDSGFSIKRNAPLNVCGCVKFKQKRKKRYVK